MLNDTILKHNKQYASHCGVCYDCSPGNNFPLPSLTDKALQHKLYMVGFDLNAFNVAIVNNVSMSLRVNNPKWESRVKVMLKHAALSNYTGEMQINACNTAGGEGCSLVRSTRSNIGKCQKWG
jgi:ABC-type phosphate transport system ATPase subunit